MITGLIASLVAPENRADPYSLYAKLRAEGVSFLPGAPVAFVSSFRDCEALLRHPGVSASRSEQTSGSGRAGILAAAGAEPPRSMRGLPITMLDPPEHTRQRSLVSKAFTPKDVIKLRPTMMAFIDDFIDALVEKVQRGEPIDVVANFSLPLPFNVICQLLGFPARDIGLLSDWSGQLLRSIDPMLAILSNHGDAASAAGAIVELHKYVERIVERRLADPGPDLLSTMLQAEQADRDLIVRFCVVLLVSGYETLVNLITNGIVGLLRQPEQWAKLRADPARAPRVVDEILRYDPPVQLIVRTAKEPLTIGKRTIEPGTTCVAFIASANRDPEAFENPDTFDPDRLERQHLAFGVGHHYCIGAALAKLEAILALARFAQRIERPTLVDGPLRYRPGFTIRGLQELLIRAESVAPRTLPWPAVLEASVHEG